MDPVKMAVTREIAVGFEVAVGFDMGAVEMRSTVSAAGRAGEGRFGGGHAHDKQTRHHYPRAP
jgi:hypothetical protein